MTLARRPVRAIVLCFSLLISLLMLINPYDARPIQAGTAPVFRIAIPDIALDAPVITLRRTKTSWNVARLSARTTGHLQGTLLPGEGGNVVIAAHVETYALRPGPFKRLHELQPGAEILITYGDVVHRYLVQEQHQVRPNELWPVAGTKTEILTLITCTPDDSNLPEGRYALRLIIRAVRA